MSAVKGDGGSELMELHESTKRYLVTIYMLAQEQGYVRAVDVGKSLGYSGASVSRAVHILQSGGYLKQAPNRFLLLTDEGNALARTIKERHAILEAFLREMGVSRSAAAEDAYRLEHDLSEEAFQSICRKVKT